MTEPLAEEAIQALALVTTEWFKTVRRLMRLTQEISPARMQREHAQLAYAQTEIADVLKQNGLRLVTHDGTEFSAQLPAEPVNPEDFDSEEGLVVIETLEPTVLFQDRIVARGRVVLAKAMS